jgi:hypothetical protein
VTVPENTSARPPELHLLGAFADGMPGYIEDMEAAGQRQVVASDVLPIEAPWAELEQLGFTRTDPIASDDLFVNCTLPAGWRREGSDHAMWSYVLDERGVRRVAIFYKAAFYDRRAFARIDNVGRMLAHQAIYGDGPATVPECWPVLTDDERDDFRDALTDWLDDAASRGFSVGIAERAELVARARAIEETTA